MSEEQLRTIAVRVPASIHGVVTLMAQLNSRPLNEEVRAAIDEHVARSQGDMDLASQAEAALAAIDADAAQRRMAIESLLKKGPSRGRKGVRD